MTDVPTLTSATQANYCVLNAASIGADATLSNGNLDIAYGSNNTRNATMGTFGVSSGKWYWEVTITASNLTPTGAIIGITENSSASAVSNYPGNNANDWGYYGNTGNKYTGGTGFAYGATYTTNDVIGVALDMDAGTLTFYKNNVSQGQATSGLTGTKFPAIGDGGGVNTFSASLNFGQRPFAYTPPTGLTALNTSQLPEPSIQVSTPHVAATTDRGTTGVVHVTNTSGFKPDLVWIKVRSTTGSNVLQDSVRGTTAYLQSNATSAENTNTSLDWFRSFNSNGFTVSSTTTGGTPTSEWNTSGNTYVAWQWKAGGSAVSNTAGTITSQVSANPSAGFSIVAYTGNGTGGATIGHGLGVAPAIIIIKQRSTASVNGNWAVYHKSLGNTGYLGLNLTSAVANDIGYWNNTSPTSSVFSVGTFEVTNRSTATYVAYCFSEVAGYSKTFSYTGNGSTDGVFIYLGFKPRFVMVKRTDSLGSWHIVDAARSSYNQMGLGLFPDLSSAEAADFNSDALSNGLKIRNSQGEINASGGTYIGIAFSENPFKYSLAQ